MKKIAIAIVVVALCVMYATANAQTEPQVYVPYISGGTGTDTGTPSPTLAPTSMPTQTPTMPTVEPTTTPVPTEDITPVATPGGTVTPTPVQNIKMLSARMDMAKRRLYVEIFNNGEGNACTVRVNAVFYYNDNIVGTGNGTSMMDVVHPGRRAPVAIYIPDTIANADRFTLSLGDPAPCTKNMEEITVLSSALYSQPVVGSQVTGQVKNQTATTLSESKVVVTFYESDGTIWSGHFSYSVPTVLPADGIGDYLIVTYYPGLYLGYTLQAEGRR